ncbi:futalosine hydrolase [Pseudodesulfovibrio sediminis]|uniref:Futalosine hydrolase n=1 Tax=Pseudodesulfovibrio sediminis TaxID=2810563 RepID=A0ABM7P4G0_9BACT|nr:futalosine hydrolase [Pseudodesulfovibrio sediminis]BCS88508.1 Futalosine hydrolase [Pseudodesulfovibrio sediminis]
MILVVTATAKEMKSAFPHAPRVEQGEAVEFVFQGKPLLLAVTGVGLINASMAAGRLLAREDISGVVNVGIAGAYNEEEFPLLSTCYAWQETWPEYGLLDDEGRVDPKGIGFAQGEIDGTVIWNRVKLNPVNDAEAMGLKLGKTWLRASSVSVSSVTGTFTRAGWLKVICNGDMENMEGFGLAYAARQMGLPFLQLRTLSNVVGSRDSVDWDLKGALRGLEAAVQMLFAE